MTLRLVLASGVLAATLAASNAAGAAGVVTRGSSTVGSAATSVIPVTDYDWRERRRHDDDDWRRRRYWHSEYRYERRSYGYCRAWRHECAERWGWGGWGFRRCLARHGC
jgi:hypothetical protein